MRADAPECVAAGRGCGTATGWRNKGRCSRCRAAHNEDTAARRRARNAPAPEVVAAYVQYLRDGHDPTEAARRAGIHPTRARALAQDHPEVAEALGGPDRPASPRTRQVAFLKAVLDHAGNYSQAAAAAGVSGHTINNWQQDPAFAHAATALRAFASGRMPRPRREQRLATDQQFEQYLRYLGQGFTKQRATEQAGLSTSSIAYRAGRDQAFAARLEAVRPTGRRSGRQLAPMTVSEEKLRELWADGTLPLAAVARAAGLSVAQLHTRAGKLSLPPRPKGT